MQTNRTRVLVVRFSSIGDIVLTTPVVRCLKQQWDGNLELHFITRKAFAPVLEGNPHIDKLITIESKVSEVADQISSGGYDYVFDLHNNLRSGQVKRLVPGLAFTVDKINRAKWLMVNFKVNRLPNLHIVDRYMATTKAFGIENDGLGLDYFINETDTVNIEDILPARAPYVAFAIGGAHATKRMPVEQLIAVCKRIKKAVILLGGPGDKETGDAVANAAGAHVFNACGPYNINESASLVEQADRVISHDTGLMHIAAALGKDVISVWGNTIPAFGMSPYLQEGKGSSTVMEVNELSCRPCSKIGYENCPKKHFRCMVDQDVEAIAAAANK